MLVDELYCQVRELQEGLNRLCSIRADEKEIGKISSEAMLR